MNVSDDTIAAIATAAGIGGVGIVRLSGPRAIPIAAALLAIAPEQLTREVRVGWVKDGDARIDQVLAFAMRSPSSFTGEDVAELHGHGGSQNLEKLLAATVARGARIAEPGEFTRRAVANGKLDLLRAEALLEVIHAGSERAWRLAQSNLAGQLGARVAALEARALKVLAEIEGSIDFPEDDLETQERAWVESELDALRAGCTALVDGFRHGRAVSHGITVALVGPVNVGKSSLLNALVGSERALVAAEPGTTRDWLEVQTTWNAIAVTLIDTAGRRDDAGAIEQRGIALGEQRVATADVVVVVNDGIAKRDDGARYAGRAVLVRSKCDLDAGVPAEPRLVAAGERDTRETLEATEASDARATSETIASGATGATGASGATDASGATGAISTSATTGEGLDVLRARVLAVAGVADREGSEDAVVTTARQRALAEAARDAFTAALSTWRARRPAEVVAVELRHGMQTLAQLRGVEVGDRVLDEVFARFCIGK